MNHDGMDHDGVAPGREKIALAVLSLLYLGLWLFVIGSARTGSRRAQAP